MVPDHMQGHDTYGAGGVRARELGVGSHRKIFCTLIMLSTRVRGNTEKDYSSHFFCRGN